MDKLNSATRSSPYRFNTSPMNDLVPSVDPWYVLRVRQKSELKVSSYLESLGLNHMVPVRIVDRQWTDRRVTTNIPLFPGYVFCQFNSAYSKPLLCTPGVVSVVSFGSAFAAVDEHEIYSIQQLMKGKLPLSTTSLFFCGQRVAVTEGPLRGIEGWVEETRPDILLIRISFFQRAISVKLQRSALTPAPLPSQGRSCIRSFSSLAG
jgi:transcription antitermination factor NusG